MHCAVFASRAHYSIVPPDEDRGLAPNQPSNNKPYSKVHFGHILLTLGPPFAIGAVADVSYRTEQRMFRHLWQLRQIVPEEARR